MTETNNKVVSSDGEELILVDMDDRAIGHLGKALCHDGEGVLHRAFSLFVFDDDGRLLMQRRSSNKRLWPLYWSNSCCSHPRRGETMEQATRRRLREELGIGSELQFVYKFGYQASFGDLGSENELCSVYLGRSLEDISPNENEIAETRLIEPADLRRELDVDPDGFTPWFRMEWDRLTLEFPAELARYTEA